MDSCLTSLRLDTLSTVNTARGEAACEQVSQRDHQRDRNRGDTDSYRPELANKPADTRMGMDDMDRPTTPMDAV